MLAAKEIEEARSAAHELRKWQTISLPHTCWPRPPSAEGYVLLAEGKPNDALTELRNAWQLWCALEAPYDAARSRVAIGLACRAMGDPATAELEFEAARREFQRLGAQPDLEAPTPSYRAQPIRLRWRGLTLRESRKFCARLRPESPIGRSREDLGISEKTVARHVSNIFTKLGLSSRAAATAYAYQHHLVNSAT